MIKLTNAYLVGIITATLLVGCGGSNSDGSVGDDDSTQATTPTTQPVEPDNDTGGGSDSDGSVGDDGSTQATTPTTQPVEPDNGTGGGTTATPPTTSASKKFGADVMPILVGQCQSCHGSNGRFTVTSASSTYNNISALKSPVTAAGQYLLNKASGTISHGGGVRFSASSTQYATIKSWVDAGAQNN